MRMVAELVPRREVEVVQPKRERRPEALAVEAAAYCNLDCPFCRYGKSSEYIGKTSHSDIPRQFGIMDFDLYKNRIIPAAVEFGIRMIQLHFQGEPLLNKRLPDMIRLGKEVGMFMQFFTNGLPMTEPIMDALLDSGVDQVRFSIDGNSQETYKQNRVGGDFDKVIQILSTFSRKARERNHPINIQWSFIVIRNNEHELEGAAERARALGVEFMSKVLNTSDPALQPLHQKYHRIFKIKPCRQIYNMFNILWNGDVAPCCYDTDGSVVLGNIKETTMLEIWDSPTYRQFRDRLARVRARPDEEPALCKSCPMWK